MSVGRDRALWARDGCLTRTHTPARADRVPAIWKETELVRLSQ